MILIYKPRMVLALYTSQKAPGQACLAYRMTDGIISLRRFHNEPDERANQTVIYNAA